MHHPDNNSYPHTLKLFYRYVNGKLKTNHNIEKLRRGNIEYTDQEMAKIMSEHFNEVFTRENDKNEEIGREKRSPPMSEIIVSRQDIENEMEDVDVKNVMVQMKSQTGYLRNVGKN